MLEDENADKQQPLLGRNFLCFLQMLFSISGEAKRKKTKKTPLNWKDMDWQRPW